MIKLRAGQREVAAYRGGHMAVPAVPGAGKTTVLAYLAADLIREGLHRPGKILIVTVMNSAVSNFSKRIGDFLEHRGLSRTAGYEVKTLHSLAMSILKEKPEFLMINEGFQVIDESYQSSLLEYLARDWTARNRELWESHIKIEKSNAKWYPKALAGWEAKTPELFRSAINYIKSEGLTADEIEGLGQRAEEGSYLSWALEVYRSYQRELNRGGMLDFDDLIVQALRLLREDPGVLARLRERWTFCFEDEAQDSNPLQGEILKLLSAKSGNLLRVGDSNQAIMGTFTAAEPEIFRRFSREEGVLRESISRSSRSTGQIMDVANYLVDWVRSRHPQEECRVALEDLHILPVGEDDPWPNPVADRYTVAVRYYKTYADEVRMVAKLARDHVKRNPDLTAAILVPTNFYQEDVKVELTALGAPLEEIGKLTGRQVGTMRSVELALRYLARPHGVESLRALLEDRMMMEFDAITGDFLDELFRRYAPEHLLYPVGGGLPWQEIPDALADAKSYTAFLECIGAVRRWLDASVQIPPDELVLYLAQDMGLDADQLDIAHNLALLVRQKMREIPGCQLCDIVRELESLKGPLRHFLKVINDQKGYVPQRGTVTLTTAHKAKGLEWDTVYLVGVTPYEYPSTVRDKFRSDFWFLKEDLGNPLTLIKSELKGLLGEGGGDLRDRSKTDEISERLRLLYVGITRAKRNLLMSCHLKDRFKRKAGPGRALVALEEFIREESARYDGIES